MTPHLHTVTIYYEDTDLSGSVYHANYLKYFERAREHFFGVERLASMVRDMGVSWVVYRCEMKFKAPARHGDTVEVRSTPRIESDYRVTFEQSIFRADRVPPLVTGTVELVCIDRGGGLVPVPPQTMAEIRAAL